MMKSFKARLRAHTSLSFFHAYPHDFKRLTFRAIWLAVKRLPVVVRQGMGCFFQPGNVRPQCLYHGAKARAIVDG